MTYPVIKIVDRNANPDLCGPCGGKCCQHMPGSLLPEDVDPAKDRATLLARVRTMLQSGRYTLDHYVGDPRSDKPVDFSVQGFYLRPAIKGKENRWSDESWSGTCTFHSEKGCTLPPSDMPYECRALIPVSDTRCDFPEGWKGKQAIATAWWPYQTILRGLLAQNRDTD